MEERVITDLAMIPDELLTCPVCHNGLSVSIVPYRYVIDGASRTSYAGLLFCKHCNEYYGNNIRLRRIRDSIIKGKRKNEPDIEFPTHSLIKEADDSPSKYVLSSYFIREKKDYNPSPLEMARWDTRRNRWTSSPINLEQINTVQVPVPEVVYTHIQETPAYDRINIDAKDTTEKPKENHHNSSAKQNTLFSTLDEKIVPDQRHSSNESTASSLPLKQKLNSFSEIVKYYNAPKSTVLALQYQNNEDQSEPFLFIVSDKEDQDGTNFFYYISSKIGNSVMEAVLRGECSFSVNGISYCILHKYVGKDFKSVATPRKQIIQLIEKPETLVDIYVYNLRGLCRIHGRKTERIVVNMISSRSTNPHPLEVYYCPVCCKFYVNYEKYFDFYKKYGIPPVRLFGESATGDGNTLFSTLRSQSDLYLFGYNVSGELADNLHLRQAILEDIVDSGNLSKAQVISHLEWLIRFNSNKEKMRSACCRWKSDLRHIESYQPRYSDIWGQFKAADYKVLL